jgi:hypothetical protein
VAATWRRLNRHAPKLKRIELVLYTLLHLAIRLARRERIVDDLVERRVRLDVRFVVGAHVAVVVDDENLVPCNADGAIGDRVGRSIAKAGVERLGVRREEAQNVGEALRLENVGRRDTTSTCSAVSSRSGDISIGPSGSDTLSCVTLAM